MMIGPKVTHNEIMLGPQQRSEQERRNDNYDPYSNKSKGEKKATLKKSSSKDSLVSNMLQSVTKFLGGGGGDQAKNEVEQ